LGAPLRVTLTLALRKKHLPWPCPHIGGFSRQKLGHAEPGLVTNFVALQNLNKQQSASTINYIISCQPNIYHNLSWFDSIVSSGHIFILVKTKAVPLYLGINK